MPTVVEKFNIQTQGFDDLIDVTLKTKNFVSKNNIQNGLLNVYVVSSCASVVIIEDEPKLGTDFIKFIQSLLPVNKVYEHDNSWHDENAYCHLRAMILNNSVTIPVIDSDLALDTWQKIVLIDFNNRPSSRQIIMSVVY